MTASLLNILKPAILLLAGLLWVGGISGVSQAVEVPESTIKAHVSQYVQTQLEKLLKKEGQETISVEIVRVPGGPFVFKNASQPEDVKMTLDSSLEENGYSERSVVRIHLEDAAGETRDFGVPVHITIQKPVWVIKNSINANSPLNLSDVSLETRNVSYNYEFAVGQERNLNDYITRVSLRPGEVLDSRKILLPPDVRCNNDIRILMSSDSGMTISVPGVALANGRIGDTIRVRQSLYQRKYYNAKIIDKNQVLVEM